MSDVNQSTVPAPVHKPWQCPLKNLSCSDAQDKTEFYYTSSSENHYVPSFCLVWKFWGPVRQRIVRKESQNLLKTVFLLLVLLLLLLLLFVLFYFGLGIFLWFGFVLVLFLFSFFGFCSIEIISKWSHYLNNILRAVLFSDWTFWRAVWNACCTSSWLV